MKPDQIVRSHIVPLNPQTKLNNPTPLFLPNKIGETYVARVANLNEGSITLEFIDFNLKLSASTTLQLKHGQSLKLQLTQTSPIYEFKVINLESDSSSTAFRVLLPKQSALQLDYLQWFKILPTLIKIETFPEQVKLALQQFFQSLPQHNELINPTILKLLLNNSGLFHEKKAVGISSAKTNKQTSTLTTLYRRIESF